MLAIQKPRYQIDLEEDDKKGNNLLNPKRSKGKGGNKKEKVFNYSVESKEHMLESMESNALVDLINSQIGRDYAEYKGRPRYCNKRCKKKREERENRKSSSESASDSDSESDSDSDSDSDSISDENDKRQLLVKPKRSHRPRAGGPR